MLKLFRRCLHCSFEQKVRVLNNQPNNKRGFKLLLAAVACLWANSVLAEKLYTGKVIAIHDGDTLVVLDNLNRQHTVRLAEIDAPEKEQAFGTRAKQALSELCFGKIVQVDVQTIDRYGREVAYVRVGHIDVNSQQIMNGFAWVYRAYSKNPRLLELEAKARLARLGLWAMANPQPPWEFRRGGKQSLATPTTISTLAACGSKRYCKEMQSCEEAYHFLQECKLSSLDADGDGVPCEAICP